MSEKQELIRKMLDWQEKFRAYEHEHGVSEQDIYTAPEGSFLREYSTEYARLADRVVNLAHEEKGSVRD